jgi:hypothetical protein
MRSPTRPTQRTAAMVAAASAAISLLVMLAVGTAADVARASNHALPLLVHATADPAVKQGHDPYVSFALSRASVGQKYRITQVSGPKSVSGKCVSALTTEWQLAFKGGKVVFDLEPVTSGKYDDVLRWSPCRGTYVLKVERRVSHTSQPTVRRFSFSYPSFKIAYLPIRP